MRKLLIVFVKNAELGKIKTRLAVTIGNDRALNVYKALLQHTLAISRNLDCEKIVYYSDFIPNSDQWKESGFHQALQSGSNLGERMHNAFDAAFKSRFDAVVIIGSDCYELDAATLTHALISLDTYDAVIGPAFDGGYYLLGMKNLLKTLFIGKNWSSSTVFAETAADLAEMGLTTLNLEARNDIDDEQDLLKSGLASL